MLSKRKANSHMKTKIDEDGREYQEKKDKKSGKVYRYYVDELMTPKDMTGDDMLKLQTIFKNNTLVLSDVIKKSIEIVTEITNYTSVVLGNTSSINRLKKVEVIPLGDNKIITMIINGM